MAMVERVGDGKDSGGRYDCGGRSRGDDNGEDVVDSDIGHGGGDHRGSVDEVYCPG